MKQSLIIVWITVSITLLVLIFSFPESADKILVGWITVTVALFIAYLNTSQVHTNNNPRMIVGNPPNQWPIRKWPWTQIRMGFKVKSWLLVGPKPRYRPRRY